MVWIGLDDTDSVEHGCTTWDFHLLLTHIEEGGFAVVGYPSLVRLWPFAPERTRGNAALCAEIDVTESNSEKFLTLLDNWYSGLYSDSATKADAIVNCCPTLIFTPEKFNERWYWDAVRNYVNPDQREQAISEIENCQMWHGYSNRGLVGASSAIAWRGEDDWTWEATAWRQADKIGTPRLVGTESVAEMSEKFPKTILNRDPNAGDSLIAPRTPCPVLYGIRAEESDVAEQAHLWLQQCEDVEQSFAMRVHRSNQATDDHISDSCSGMVISEVTEVQGGHASISVFDGSVRVTLTAFKQGGDVNRLLKSLKSGDKVEWRGLQSPNQEIHLESMILTAAVPRKLSRPECECGGRLSRKGIGQPLQCNQCGSQLNSIWIGQAANLSGTWLQPKCANRRHLAKPLNREAKG
jgi:tRNA(Ile2)-agmatinylcytidine synthase